MKIKSFIGDIQKGLVLVQPEKQPMSTNPTAFKPLGKPLGSFKVQKGSKYSDLIRSGLKLYS